MGFLVGSPNCCPPLLNVFLSPWLVCHGEGPKLDPGCHWVSDRPWSCKELEPSGPGVAIYVCAIWVSNCVTGTQGRGW